MRAHADKGADCAGFNLCARRYEASAEADLLVDRQDPGVLARRVDHPLPIVNRRGDRFLHQHMPPGLERADRLLGMQRVRRADIHGRHVRVRERCLERGIHFRTTPKLLGDLACASGVRIAQRDNPRHI
jgi:hypothetical protein